MVRKFRRNQRQLLSGRLRLYTHRALKQLLKLHGFGVIASKGITYSNLPPVLRHLDSPVSKMPSLAQIIMVLARK